jgi:Flp pilus assembly protein TadG
VIRRQEGQSMVEVALVLPVLLLILLGIFDFGRAIFAYNLVSNAAREGARAAIVDQNPTVVEDEARATAISLDPALMTVTFTTCAPPIKIGCEAIVTVDYEWSAITPLMSSVVGPISLSSTTEMPIERVYVSP